MLFLSLALPPPTLPPPSPLTYLHAYLSVSACQAIYNRFRYCFVSSHICIHLSHISDFPPQCRQPYRPDHVLVTPVHPTTWQLQPPSLNLSSNLIPSLTLLPLLLFLLNRIPYIFTTCAALSLLAYIPDRQNHGNYARFHLLLLDGARFPELELELEPPIPPLPTLDLSHSKFPSNT